MVTKFKETTIPEDFSKTFTLGGYAIGPANVDKIAAVAFDAVSCLLAKTKSTSTPRGISLSKIDGEFIAGAKIEFIPNGDDPSSGRWDYSWTFYKEDMNDVDIMDFTHPQFIEMIAKSAKRMYNFSFVNMSVGVNMILSVIDMIKTWLLENAKDTERVEMTLDGYFKAFVEKEDGEAIIGITPSGEMKVLIKDDSVIQEK